MSEEQRIKNKEFGEIRNTLKRLHFFAEIRFSVNCFVRN